MAGSTLFTKIVAQLEPTYGTGDENQFNDAPNNTRRLMVSPTGVINFGETWDIGADRTVGLRNPVIAGRSTLTETAPEITLEAPAVPTDELPIYLAAASAIGYGTNEDGSTLWNWDPQDDEYVNGPYSLHAIVTDGQNKFHASGILPISLTLSAESGGLTSLAFSGFAKQIVPTNVTPTAGLPDIAPRSIAGRTWVAYVGESFGGGAPIFNYLYDWSLELQTGLTPIFSQVGATNNAGYNQFGSAFGGTLSLTVGSTEAAANAFLTKRGQPVYITLETADAGTPQHRVSIALCGIVTSVEPIGGDVDGLTTHAVEIALAHDPAAGKTVSVSITNSLPALPAASEEGS